MKKTIKKTLSAILALSLSMAMFASAQVSAHSNAAALISKVGETVDIDFNYTTDTTITRNHEFAAGITASHVSDTHKVYADNQYLQMGDAGTDSRLTITDNNWQTSNLTKDRYFTEFKFKLNELSPVKFLFVAELCDKFDKLNTLLPNTTPTSPGVRTSVILSGSNYYIKAGDTNITKVAIKEGMWYNVKLDINMINRTYDIYVDGVLGAAGIAFTGGDTNLDGKSYFDYLKANDIEFPNKFNRIFQYRDNNTSDYAVDICFDDIRVYKEPTGVITYGGDDFSNYKTDVVYDASKVNPSFAGLAAWNVAERQCNFTIDADKGYAISGTGATAGKTINGMFLRINNTEPFYKEKSIVTEFKITPQADSLGTIQFLDKASNTYGVTLAMNGNKFTATDANGNTELGSFVKGETYKIKVCMDANRIAAKTGKAGICDIYINDKHVLSNAPIKYGSGESITGFGDIKINFKDSNQAYFDDFRVYSDEKEEVLSRLAADMKAAYPSGVIEVDVNTLPKTYALAGRHTYNIDWSLSGKTIDNGVNHANTTALAKIYYPGEENYYITGEFDYYKPDFSVNSPVDFEINAVTFEDASGNKVYGPTDGGKLTGVTIKRHVDKEADLYVAVYNGTRFSNVECFDNVTDGDIDLNLSVDKNSMVKFFVWTNDDKLTPLASPFEVQKESRKLFILSDAIYDEEPPASLASTGIGYALKSFYKQDNLEIVNLAITEQPTMKRFVKSGLFAEALEQIQQGDYVLLSYCHNDSKWPAEPMYAEPLDADGVAPYDMGSYEYYFEQYVAAIRSKGGIPVIATSIPRWQFKNDVPTSSHGNYYTAEIAVANYLNVPLLDVYAEAISDLADLKAEDSKKYYVEPVDTNGDGNIDATHLSAEGAEWVAGIIVELADKLNLPFSAYKTAK